jgi:hypothetical protein
MIVKGGIAQWCNDERPLYNSNLKVLCLVLAQHGKLYDFNVITAMFLLTAILHYNLQTKISKL